MHSVAQLNMIYVLTLGISALAFLYLRMKWRDRVPEVFFWIHFFIVSWSALIYLNLVFSTPIAPFAYYMDWIVSTPLIMLALSFTAMYPLSKIHWPSVFALMMTQAMVISTGYLAQISTSEPGKLSFFAVGNMLMLIIFYLVFVPLKKIAEQNAQVKKKYLYLSYLLVTFWISYPVVWILGTAGYGILSSYYTNLLFIVLPILCKPVFGFIDLFLLKSLHDKR